MTEPFAATYYQSRNYQHYLERRFGQLAQDVKLELSLTAGTRVLDYGCGYGGLTAALFASGVTDIYGTDISQWAIDHGKVRFPDIADRLHYYDRNLLINHPQVVLFLDVLEHMPEFEIENVLTLAAKNPGVRVLARIPITDAEGHAFVLPVSNNDPTHITCHTRSWWYDIFRWRGLPLQRTVDRSTIYDSPGVLVALFGTPQ